MFGMSGSRKWVYPLSIKGRFQKIHRKTAIFQHLVLFGLPWVVIGGHPALRIDLPARRVYALGGVFTASDTFLLLLMLLMAAFSLFFFTSLFGRLWCGYLCPQTVFLEEWIRPIEKWIEGDRGKRMARDKKPWSFDKVWRKAAKWTLFAAVSIVLSMAFMAYFAGAKELWTGQGGTVEYALVGVFSTVWFLDFAWFREQLCNYACPYARFQGALTDDESLVVAYDVQRGEPRGKGRAARDLGSCVDCGKCVSVCPQGIDIRDGFQLECITCARCIDACDSVMGKLGHESLVSYTTIAATEGRRARWLRPRTVAYAALLTGLAAAFVGLVASHTPFQAGVARAPGTLYAVDPDGHVRNTFLLELDNLLDDEVTYTVRIDGLDGADVRVDDVTLPPLGSRTVPLVVRAPGGADLPRTVPLTVTVTSDDGDEVELGTTFKTGGAMAAKEGA